jgi:hypothetical protein
MIKQELYEWRVPSLLETREISKSSGICIQKDQILWSPFRQWLQEQVRWALPVCYIYIYIYIYIYTYIYVSSSITSYYIICNSIFFSFSFWVPVESTCVGPIHENHLSTWKNMVLKLVGIIHRNSIMIFLFIYPKTFTPVSGNVEVF